MITSVHLKNWKAFGSLDLELPPGVVFVVAKNGVGKTSLLQAIYFGLFGDEKLLGSGTSVQSAIRGGGDETALSRLQIRLGNQDWVITRSVSRRSGRVVSTAETEGRRVEPAEWDAALAGFAGVDLSQLRLLAAIGEGGTYAEGDSPASRYNLVTHLSEVLGVSRLEEAADSLRRRSALLSRSVDRERLEVRERPRRAAAQDEINLRQESARLEAHGRRLEASIKALEAKLRAARAWTEHVRTIETVSARLVQAAEELESMLGETQAELDDLHLVNAQGPASVQELNIVDPAERAEMALEEIKHRASAVSNYVMELRVAEGRLQGLREAAHSALLLLEDANAVCPTCRRPLSRADSEVAIAENRGLIASLTAELSVIEERRTRAEGIGRVLTSTARMRLPSDPSSWTGPVPPIGYVPDVDERELHRAAAELEEAELEAARVHGELRRIQTERDAREARMELSRRWVDLYRQADLSMIAAAGFSSLAQRIRVERVQPLGDLLAKRWAELWPGRPLVTLDAATGRITGDVDGAALELADLSGGERAVALLLLRLLALQAASNSPLLLLDEPLEHLDPRNRRLLAGLLVAASQVEQVPTQIIVTTYEESVARRLRRDVDPSLNSDVIYVRAAS